ncbi:MAG: response regulator [Planctomycetes bacterium]|nr:response regulator [Planctomycetota bacterium]
MARILIVEDELVFRTMLETMIRLEGHEVFLAANGETGLAQARNKKPDIILSDIEMPGMDGLSLVKSVRANHDIAHAYLILVTGQGGQESKLDALRAGADDFLEKPSSKQEILGRVEIAQKVLAVQRQLREAEERSKALADLPGKVGAEIGSAEAALAAVHTAISKKDPAALAAAVKEAKEALARARAACDAGAAPAGESWL